jgi:hypothetical protein
MAKSRSKKIKKLSTLNIITTELFGQKEQWAMINRMVIGSGTGKPAS